ncbi:WYL domain-containing protein [Bacillus licheniformis]|nr:WYL domain-containing protein [Bacillus licheniformis]
MPYGKIKIKIVYQRADGQTADRVVAPLGLVAKGANWYLIASKENGEIRNYRASRIQSAVLSAKRLIGPKFDIAHVWRSSTKEFIERLPTYEVRVKAAQAILPRLSFTNHLCGSSKQMRSIRRAGSPLRYPLIRKKKQKVYTRIRRAHEDH